MPKGHYEHHNLIDMTGRQCGDWTVLSRALREDDGYGTNYWLCRCVCGTERSVSGATLRSGKSRGCGCKQRERQIAGQTKHGLSNTAEHRIWIAMRSRCSNPNTTKWNLYGERGITVDPRWDQFETFLADMGPRPSPRHSIERRDGSKGYSPENCYWATPQQQNRNTSRNHFLTYQGETLTVAEWAERRGMTYGSLSNRVADGWSTEDALTIPVARGAARVAHRQAQASALE
jgi:hypothetical protein